MRTVSLRHRNPSTGHPEEMLLGRASKDFKRVRATSTKADTDLPSNLTACQLNRVDFQTLLEVDVTMLSDCWPHMNIPKMVVSRTNHRHSNNGSRRPTRVRAEAYASALFYGECSVEGISPDGAKVAEDNVREKLSKWWLPGDDKDHPSLQLRRTDGEGASKEGEDDVESCGPSQILSTDDVSHAPSLHDDDGNNISESMREEEEIQIDQDESSLPLFARDDDLAANFATSNSHNIQVTSSHVDTDDDAVSTNSSLLPSWLSSCSHGSMYNQPTTPISPTIESDVKYIEEGKIFKQSIGSSEEMLRSYSMNMNQFMSKVKQSNNSTDFQSGRLPIPTQVVTSESEADDSGWYSCGASCDEASSFVTTKLSMPCSSSATSTSRINSKLPAKRSRSIVESDSNSSLLDQTYLEAQLDAAKSDLVASLNEDEGTESASFKDALASLEKMYRAKMKSEPTTKKRKASVSSQTTTKNVNLDGTWLMISPPAYPACLGTNANGEKMFTLGRMAFDMYQPSNLVCSIQSQYNTIKSVEKKEELPLYVPKRLRKEVDDEIDGDSSGRLKTHK
jgi:hypothetical protein